MGSIKVNALAMAMAMVLGQWALLCLYPNELLLLPLWKMFKMRKLLLFLPLSFPTLPFSLHVNNDDNDDDFVANAADADAAFPYAAAAQPLPFRTCV